MEAFLLLDEEPRWFILIGDRNSPVVAYKAIPIVSTIWSLQRERESYERERER